MSDDNRQSLRLQGKRAVALTAQELAWAHNIPLGRIDWTPDPETDAPAPVYLLTLLTDAHEAQKTISAEFLEAGWQDERRLKEQLAPLIEVLREASHPIPRGAA